MFPKKLFVHKTSDGKYMLNIQYFEHKNYISTLSLESQLFLNYSKSTEPLSRGHLISQPRLATHLGSYLALDILTLM